MSYINEQNLTEFDKNIKEYIDNKLLLDKERFAYGIEWDITVSDPHCTRIGNPELHRTLPLQSSMKGCLLADDGTVNEYLPEDDWSNSVLDGSKGQVMVELPDMYVKFESEGNKRRAWMSTMPLVGFHLWKKCYVSAYEASIQRSTNKLCSVCNLDPDYRGGNNTAEWDGTYRSLLGTPVSNMTLSEFRIAARNRGFINWNCYSYHIYKMLVWLFVVEYANFDCQEKFTTELTSEGFKKGGLGEGCTNFIPLQKYNEGNPILKAGVLNTFGNQSTSQLYNFSEIIINVSHTYINKYRGIEQFFGHCSKFIDGLISVGLKIYTSTNPVDFKNNSIKNYTFIGNRVNRNPNSYNTYIMDLIFGYDGDIIIGKMKDTLINNSYIPDANYLPNALQSINYLACCGSYGYGLESGIFNHNFLMYENYTDNSSLTRLCYIP